MNRLVVLMTAVSLATAAGTDGAARPTQAGQEGVRPLMVSYTELRWTELPERKGSQVALLSGDPGEGAYTEMRKVPAGTDNPPHTHSSEIKNVIISGVWFTGADSASARDFGPGSIIVMPANWVHVSGCRPGSECLFYQEGKGKFDYQPAVKPPPAR